jgi:uncharacterized protein
MVNGKRIGQLASVRANYDPAAEMLKFVFPDGGAVSASVVSGQPIESRFFSRVLPGWIVGDELASALSEHVGVTLRLIRLDQELTAADRGRGGGVSLISDASVAHLSELAAESVDPRRFRMLISVTGPDAHAEDRMVGQQVRIGDALVHFQGHVGRCLVTGQNPDTGNADLPTLKLLSYRKGLETTEPLAFGIYGEVLEPGTVRLGDAVRVTPSR